MGRSKIPAYEKKKLNRCLSENDKKWVLLTVATMKKEAKRKVGTAWTFSAIARHLRCDVKVILRLIKEKNRERKGRQNPQLASKVQLVVKKRQKLVSGLVRRVENGGPRFRSIASLVRALKVEKGIQSSPTTMTRDLDALGYVCRKRPRRPPFSPEDKHKRFQFARQHKGMDPKKLVFVDEKMFDTNDHGELTEWVKRGERPTTRAKSAFPVKVHVFGAIGYDFRMLIFLEGSIDSKAYCEQVLTKLVPELNKKKLTLVQDGCRVHTSKETSAFLGQRKASVLTGWPARSPDLNPIEEMWADLSRLVSKEGPKNKDDLREYVEKMWKDYPIEAINKLVISFTGRLHECEQLKGEYLTRKRQRETEG